MKKMGLIVLMMVCSLVGSANPDGILGVWMTQIKDAKVEIYKKVDKFHGRVIWMAEPKDEEGRPKVDEKNPNAKLKTRPILQIDILSGFVYSDGEWTGGTIYDPKEGETYSCKLWLENGNLMVRGYLGWLFDTKTWTRAKA
ncbi:MAG: DUF2147 domain-containing protein [Crocinitomix sp.]|nr:DUF2147 domain-containing protein [Crocinitomix sp.]